MEIVESYDSGAEYILDVLIDKSLVFISEYNDEIEMHDLIEDMGKYIVKMQKDSGKPSRIWNVEDFEDVMMDNMGAMTVEAIWFWFSYFKKPSFSKEAMKNMQRLRILSIRCLCDPWAYLSDSEDGSIEYLSNNLRWFAWYDYPWKLLPENFNPRRLVHLDLQQSSLHYLWNETKQLPSLRRLNLSDSKSLKRTPDFKGMPNLEYLDLGKCKSLIEVHHSLKYCGKLIELNLYKCESLERFPYVNVKSLESLKLGGCSILQKFPEFLGRMKPELDITMSDSEIRELPLSIIHFPPHLRELSLSFMENLVSFPSSICKLKGLVKLNVSFCSKIESLPEEIGYLENLETLDARDTPISQPPSSIIQLNKLKSLSFGKHITRGGVFFVFPHVNEGLRSLEDLNLRCCNLIDGRPPEDIGSLSSLKKLNLSGNNFEHLSQIRSLDLSECWRQKEFLGVNVAEGLRSLEELDLSFCSIIDGGLLEGIGCLSSLKELNLMGNNFEHLPRSIAQLGSLQSLDLSDCKRLKEFLGVNMAEGLCSLEELDLSECNLIDGGLLEDIGSLSSLKKLYLHGNNFEYLPRSIAHLGTLQTLDLSYCKRLRELPKFPQQLNAIFADWSNDSFCNSLFQNISSLQHDISVSDSLSLRVFTSLKRDIPSWFKYHGMGTSVSVNLPKNWYVSDKFLGFAVCYYGNYINCITAHLIPLSCDDGMSSMTQQFALSNNLDLEDINEWNIHFLLVPLGGLWDASNANGKTPNDYGCIKVDFIGHDFGETDEEFGENLTIGVRLLYKNKSELCIGIRKSRYEEEASCSSPKKTKVTYE